MFRDTYDIDIFNDVDKLCPDFNPKIAGGLVTEQMRDVEPYIENIWRQVSKEFPKGLRYISGVRCDPYETYQVMLSKKRKEKPTFELSKSTIFLMKYQLELHGKLLPPVYLFLPYVKDAGIVTINGSNFAISPVLADIALSIGHDNIFIFMNKSKVTFKRMLHHYIVNGGRPKPEYIIWCKAHNNAARITEFSKKSSNVHYLFCKEGVRGTFLKYGNNTDIRIGTNDINRTNYPIEQWTICESQRLKPSGKTGRYIPSDLKIAIRNSDYNTFTSGMIAAFFYLVDHFPERINVDNVDDVLMWRLLLGYCIFKQSESDGKLINSINTHINSMDGAVDGMVKRWLLMDNVVVDDSYDLFAYIASSFSSKITAESNKLSSLYDKRLIVLRYALSNITDGIHNANFDLIKAARKGDLTESDVVNIFRKRLKPKLIVGINQKHAEVSTVSSASDCMIFKITSNVVLQTNMSGSKSSKSKGAKFNDTMAADASIAEVCQFNNLSKSEITGRGKLNGHARIRPDGSIERNENFRELIDHVQAIVSR